MSKSRKPIRYDGNRAYVSTTDLTESGSETTLAVRSFDGDADDTASTIPYAEDDVAQIAIVSSQESLVEELSLPELCTHHYIPDGPPAPYAESIVDENEQEENDSNSQVLVSNVIRLIAISRAHATL